MARIVMRALLLTVALLTACSATGDDAKQADTGPCPTGQHLAYVTPGCTGVAPVCVGDYGDGCLVTVCTCDGRELVDGCDSHGEPFLVDGSCHSDGGNDADAAVDATTVD